MKYHVNPKTGIPNPCNALYGCPFGSEHEHFTSPEVAVQDFEARMEAQFEAEEMTKHVLEGKDLTEEQSLTVEQLRERFSPVTVLSANGINFGPMVKIDISRNNPSLTCTTYGADGEITETEFIISTTYAQALLGAEQAERDFHDFPEPMGSGSLNAIRVLRLKLFEGFEKQLFPRWVANGELVAVAREVVAANADRIALQGNWPDYISPQASLTERLPEPARTSAGFDAGVACSLDLIPRNKQALASKLHAAYTPEAVDQVREEIKNLSPDSETTWWLAACSVCREDGISPQAFGQQLEEFEHLRSDPQERLRAATRELALMKSYYSLDDGVAFAHKDGGMQAAYIDGHEVSASYAANADLYFIGTYHPSLGLEDFPWSSEVDESNRPRSGPIHGSKQFVKASTKEEYQRVIAAVRLQL